jgi:hypothetical protein
MQSRKRYVDPPISNNLHPRSSSSLYSNSLPSPQTTPPPHNSIAIEAFPDPPAFTCPSYLLTFIFKPPLRRPDLSADLQIGSSHQGRSFMEPSRHPDPRFIIYESIEGHPRFSRPSGKRQTMGNEYKRLFPNSAQYPPLTRFAPRS